jgi:hypothetical protein
LSAPGRVDAGGGDTGLVVHGKRPILEIDDLEAAVGCRLTDLGHPAGDLNRKATRAYASGDDEGLTRVYHTPIMAT